MSIWGELEPREWQVEAHSLIMPLLKTGDKLLVAATMGSGKSVCIRAVVASILKTIKPGFKILVSTPRVRLVEQLADTLSKVCSVGRYYTHEKNTSPTVIVACSDSLTNLAKEGLNFALWIIDEAHRSQCDKVLKSGIKSYSILGFSATPYLSDHTGRLTLFDRLVYNYAPSQAMVDGVVVEPRLVLYDGSLGPIADVDDALVPMIEAQYGPGLVTAHTIADSDSYAARLRSEDIRAESIHSRHKSNEQSDKIARLQSGQLDCLVDVNLLTEGVDFPWLRWLALRVPIGSRVSFAQRIGRALRACPGKEYANILDPLDQFLSHSLSYEAMLGGGYSKPSIGPKELRKMSEIDREEQRRLLLTVRLRIIPSYLRKTALYFYSKGLAEQSVSIGDWRKQRPSNGQLSAVEKLSWLTKFVPKGHRQIIEQAVGDTARLRRGDIADLLTILTHTKKKGRYGKKLWPEDYELGGELDKYWRNCKELGIE